MNYLKLLLTASFFLLPTSAFAAKVYIATCNNCTDIQTESAAEKFRSNGAIIVVTDSIRAQVKAFRIRRATFDDVEVFNASPTSVPQEIITTFEKTIAYRNQYLGELQSDYGYGAIKIGASFVDNTQNSNTLQKNNYSSTSAIELANESINAYDFMSNSALRRKIHGKLTTQYPTYTSFVGGWNKTVSIIGVSFGGAIVNINANLNALAFSPKLEFEDNSYVIVGYNTKSDTFKVIEGVDEAGNDIPTSANASIDGTYTINDTSHYNDVQTYMGFFWLIDFKGNISQGQSCSTSCRLVSSGRYECTAQCK